MKTFTLCLLACSLGLSAHAQDSFRLTGELSDDSRRDVKQLYLTYDDEFGNTITLDSAKVKRGKFTFEGAIPEKSGKGLSERIPRRDTDFLSRPGRTHSHGNRCPKP